MRSRAAVVPLLAAFLLLTACGGGYGRPNQASSQLAFGVDMARRGLWDEALFRFREAERLDPGNPRIQSNLGVAYEASGQFDKALEHYQSALKLSPNDKEIRANYARFVEFYQGFKGEKTAKSAAPRTTAPPRPPAPAPQPSPQPEPSTPEDAPPPPADVPPPV
jgi:tetratricopeptide (TPR) repeat protein